MSKEADHMKWDPLRVKDDERNQRAGLANAPHVTKAAHPYDYFEDETAGIVKLLSCETNITRN